MDSEQELEHGNEPKSPSTERDFPPVSSPPASATTQEPEPPTVAAPPPDPIWRGIDVLIVLGFTFVSLFVGLMLAAIGFTVVQYLRHGPGMQTRALLDLRFLLFAQAFGCVGGFAFAWLWIKNIYHVDFWAAVHWRRLSESVAVRALFAGIVVAFLSLLLEKFLHVPRHLPIDRLFNVNTAWYLAVYGVIIAPFFEEFAFRGLIYASLKRTFTEGMSKRDARSWRIPLWIVLTPIILISGYKLLWMRTMGLPLPLRTEIVFVSSALGALLATPLMYLVAALFTAMAGLKIPRLLAIVITGILFGLIHAQQLGNSWSPVLILSIVGAIFTAARAFTGSWMTSWLMHLAYNGVLFSLLFLATRGFRDFSHLAR